MNNLHEYEQEFLELTEQSRALMPELNQAYYGAVRDAVFNEGRPKSPPAPDISSKFKPA